jgi:hypothetical protein
VIVGDAARHAGPVLVGEALEALVHKALAPLADCHLVAVELRRHLPVGLARGTGEHDLGAQRQALRAIRAACPTREGVAFLLAQHELCLRSSPLRHVPSIVADGRGNAPGCNEIPQSGIFPANLRIGRLGGQ